MTFSPIIGAAGTDPDSAATDPAGAAVDPAAVPDPAVAADSGRGRGQPVTGANHAAGGGYAAHGAYPSGQAAAEQGGYPTSQSSAASQGYPARQGDPAAGNAGHAAYPSGQTAAEQGGYPASQSSAASQGYPASQGDPAAGNAGQGAYPTGQGSGATEQGGYPAAEQGGYSATEQGAYTTGQGAQSAGYADSSADAADSAQQDDAGTAWPHQTFLELGALPTAAPCARLHTTLVLWEWELSTLVRTAGLVVSELVSNAVQASVGLTGSRFAGLWTPGTPPVRMWLSADDHRVVIQVWDGSDRPPVPQPVDPEADRGRGLLLVGALSVEWGCYTPEKSSGKVVWAVVGD